MEGLLLPSVFTWKQIVNYININKIQTLPPHNIKTGEQKTSNYRISNPSFCASGGVPEGFCPKIAHYIDKVMRIIEKGGFFAEFIALDVLGMMGPRTVQAFLRNRDELGHLNYKAGTEEAIREVFSGPSFFIIPMTFLALSGKIFGSASKISVNTLREMKGVAKSAVENTSDGKQIVNEFYSGIVKHLYGDKLSETEHKNMTAAFEKLHNAHMDPGPPKKVGGFFKTIAAFFKKPPTEKVETAHKELINMLVAKNKEIGDDAARGISLADSSRIKFFGKKPQSIENIIEDCKNYSTDVLKTLVTDTAGNSKSKLLERISKNKIRARIGITTSAILTLSAFLYYIPYMYKQNKEFPGIDGLTEQPANDNNTAVKKRVA